MDKDTVIVFDYTKEAIEKIVVEAKKVDVTNIEEVKESHKILVKVRTTITKQGLAFRADANAYNKSVSAKEKEYLAISVEMEEDHKKILDEDKENRVIEARKELLPGKRSQLELLEHATEISDEEILKMDDEEWVRFYQLQMEINQKEVQRKKDEVEAEKNRKEREKEIKKEERAKAEAKFEKQKKEEQEKLEIEKKKKEEEFERIKKEEDEERKKTEKNVKYKKFLKDNNFDEATDIIKREENTFTIYRKVESITLN